MSILTDTLNELNKSGKLKELIEDKLYSAKEICTYLLLDEKQVRNINNYFRKNNITLPYPKINNRSSRIIEKYKDEVNHWWDIPLLKEAIEDKLENNLVINYADKEKTCGRYVINFKYHPRASSAGQVKAHIILWELYNKKTFPDNYVLVPKDKNFLNLNINNFDLYSNEEYRSIVATSKRNHFYTTGSQDGICYKGGWKTLAKKLIKEIGKCEICGCNELHKLNMHHIISYYLFDKPKDAHFRENLICVCDSCHSNIHLNKINLSGTLSEKIKLKLFELLEKLKVNISKENENYEKHCNLLDFTYKSISSQAEINLISEGSTTISKESTLQANGNGSGKPLTDNAEGDDIV